MCQIMKEQTTVGLLGGLAGQQEVYQGEMRAKAHCHWSSL